MYRTTMFFNIAVLGINMYYNIRKQCAVFVFLTFCNAFQMTMVTYNTLFLLRMNAVHNDIQ